MDNFKAIGLAEGFINAQSEQEVIDAWQHLIDTGIVWRLQGWFGRNAKRLIENGTVKPANRRGEK
jgi:fatty acid-binding protein DegV